MTGQRAPLANRLWDRIDRSAGPNECWPWTGAAHRGYGYVHGGAAVGRKTVRAHRVAYEMANDCEVDETGVVDHLCRNRLCCNPSHLEAVTHKENTLRGEAPTAVNARKSHCIRGHEFTAENTYVYRSGTRPPSRHCKTCERSRRKRYRANANKQKES